MKKEIIIALIVGFFCMVIGFSIAKITNKKPVDVIIPDYSVYERREDSIMGLYKLRGDTIAKIYKQIDSLKSAKNINHKKLNNDIKVYKGFSLINRIKFIDSIYSATIK